MHQRASENVPKLLIYAHLCFTTQTCSKWKQMEASRIIIESIVKKSYIQCKLVAILAREELYKPALSLVRIATELTRNAYGMMKYLTNEIQIHIYGFSLKRT